MDERRTCGRPKSSGEPCGQLVRYSVPHGRYAPACRKHMTAVERGELEADPLWSEHGQVMWLLDTRDAEEELLPTARIAKELRLQQSVVQWVLRELEDQGKVMCRKVDRRDCWGNRRQRDRLLARERESALRVETERAARQTRNRALDDVKHRLRDVLADHAIGVSSLSDMTPGMSYVDRQDQIVVMIDDPEEAAWLLRKLIE